MDRLMRYEWHRDFSDRPSFLSDVQGVLQGTKDRNSRTDLVVGGRKELVVEVN